MKIISNISEVPQKDFLAVYDKKIIWRANLYIDEGDNDWNNLHPWIEGNEWNTNDAGVTVVGENAGKQVISIKPWTRINDVDYCPGGNVQNKVAYFWGGTNTPFEFNNGMVAQKDIITQKRAVDSDYKDISWNNDTYAPGSDWDNYVHPKRADNPLPFVYSNIKINDQDYHPLIPGLTNYALFYGIEHEITNAYTWAQTLYSLGVDCSGFVYRTKKYKENNRFVYNDKYEALEFIERHNVVYEGVVPKANFYKEGNYSMSIPLVPGDVVTMEGHIMMVFLLKEIEDDGGVKFNNIVFVEAASGLRNEKYIVFNNQSLWDYLSLLPSKSWYEFKRLRRNY